MLVILNNIQIPELYDYIVINGVLEYANGFTNSENPYERFFENVHRYLKPTGTLLLAIENRLGIKYFLVPVKIIRITIFWD